MIENKQMHMRKQQSFLCTSNGTVGGHLKKESFGQIFDIPNRIGEVVSFTSSEFHSFCLHIYLGFVNKKMRTASAHFTVFYFVDIWLCSATYEFSTFALNLPFQPIFLKKRGK
jgi:hypothetical protein